jgi:hypothetical protein
MNFLNLTTIAFLNYRLSKVPVLQGASRLPASRFTDLFMADASTSFPSMPDDEKWSPWRAQDTT